MVSNGEKMNCNICDNRQVLLLKLSIIPWLSVAENQGSVTGTASWVIMMVLVCLCTICLTCSLTVH